MYMGLAKQYKMTTRPWSKSMLARASPHQSPNVGFSPSVNSKEGTLAYNGRLRTKRGRFLKTSENVWPMPSEGSLGQQPQAGAAPAARIMTAAKCLHPFLAAHLHNMRVRA